MKKVIKENPRGKKEKKMDRKRLKCGQCDGFLHLRATYTERRSKTNRRHVLTF